MKLKTVKWHNTEIKKRFEDPKKYPRIVSLWVNPDMTF